MKIKLGLGKTDMEKIAMWCGGELYDFSGDIGCEFEYVCTDSREADENTMFVATRGERVDGHDYILKAIEAGCRCVLCEYVPTDISGKAVAYAVVENSIDAFADCAKGYSAEHKLETVAITGSVGKTTTKELTFCVLKMGFKTYCTVGNFNSVIGMPMSLMEVEDDCEAAVFEMGMSGFGEISRMTRAACPDIAMVTNIGSSHLEYLKTRENIAKAKLEIAEGLSKDGYLLLNGDEPLLRKGVHKASYKVLYVGIENECDITAKNIRVDSDGTSFDLFAFGKTLKDIKISLVGKHFVYNASFAATVGLLMGIGDDDIKAGLASYVSTGMRQNISSKGGMTVIADCYNAAPESMRGALDTLGSLKVSGRRVAVLGDMRELGSDSDNLHRSIGEYAVNLGVDLLFTLGESGAIIAESAIKHGMNPECVFAERDGEAAERLATEIKGKIREDDAILFKASRAMALERIIESLFED